MNYETPAIADYGDLVAVTASQHDGNDSDAAFPCGRWCDPALS
ncbi:MAG: lasso RiPP family leader peptide-containing protein [Solirubrobacterales bacterium]